MKIADLPTELKPREKAIRYGIESLSDVELLALLIGSGIRGCSALEIGDNLLRNFIHLKELATADFSSIKSIKGLGGVRSLNLLASFEMHRRLSSPIYNKSKRIEKASDIFERYQHLETLEYEVLMIAMLNKKKEIIREITKYKGTSTSFSINLREIIKELLSSNCTSFILIHNHPDGESFPSKNDILITEMIKNKTRDFEMDLDDHVIIFRGGYFSFREKRNFFV